MIEKKSKYDPAIYGRAKADFLNRLSGSPKSDGNWQDEENRRQDFLREIKEGKIILER